eukprot:scpid105001/ scgid3636/ 
MPKSLFDAAMERELMELYVVIFAGSAGKTLTANEKHTLIAERMNAKGKSLGWATLNATNIDNKLDGLRRKGKKMYKTFRSKTRTGAPVEDDFDLKVIQFLLLSKQKILKLAKQK